MSTRSSARNLFPPLDNPELTIRRRSHSDPTLLNNSEMAAEGPGDLPNSCQFHGLPGDDDNKHLDKFLHVTQSIKVNGVTNDALRLYLFAHSLTHHATVWFDRLPRNSINTFEQMAKMFLGEIFSTFNGGTFMKRRPEECYDLIENMTTHHNDWDTSAQRITPNCETCGGPHSFSDCPAIVGNTQNVYAAGTYQGGSEGYYNSKWNQGPTIPTTSSSPVVERETEATKDTVHPTNNGSTEDVQPSIVQSESLILNSEPVNSPIIEPVASPVSAPRPNQRPSIPYPSSLQDQKLRNKANDQREKFFQIFKDLNFNISFADALILMPKFGLSIKSLLTNKDKLSELTRTPLNEHCSAVLLKKFPEKLGDPGKFLIPNVQLNELHDQAYEISLIYKEKTKRLHDSKIKDRVFNIGDRVLLFNS
nr:reverse transcriptase domain-containing protein [Tanacetum cinerariifolium]